MEITKSILFAITCCFICCGLKSQNYQNLINREVYFNKHSKIPQYIEFNKGSNLQVNDVISFFYQKYNVRIELKELSKIKGKLGVVHSKFQQQFNGKDVELGTIIIHSKNNTIYSMNGFLVDQFPVLPLSILTEEKSLAKVLDFVGGIKYKWENEREENWLKISKKNRYATYFPKGELVWCSKNFSKEKRPSLAYKFSVYVQEPLSKSIIYIDAKTGNILAENESIHHFDAIGTGLTNYSGTRTITTDQFGGGYRLRESGRGDGIETYSMQNDIYYSNAIDLTNQSNNWGGNSSPNYLSAIGAHWGAEMVYDYYYTIHNRNSIDGNGAKLKNYVNYDANFPNAFWDGSVMTYGDGVSGGNPHTSLTLVGHEITHGLIENTSNLIYFGESGALNESFSDVFGVSIEQVIKPNQSNWLLGDEIGNVIRDMSNPHALGHPDTYKGLYWEFSNIDNGGVHTNSGVQNYWYYLLVNGGIGTNDFGDNYNIPPIGRIKSEKIAFRCLTNYLVNSSDYNEARFYSIQSAIDLYGACSSEVEAVTNAWFAVGVGAEYTPGVLVDFDSNIKIGCEIPLTVQFQNLSINGVSFNWDFGDGVSSTDAAPIHTYSNHGSYDVTLVVDGNNCGSSQAVKNNFIIVDNSISCTNLIAGSTIYESSCEGLLLDTGGETQEYINNESSIAVIDVAEANQITLEFLDFDIEEHISCSNDYLEVYDGNSVSSMLMGRYCNDNPPPAFIQSSGGSITLKFFSNNDITKRGFKCRWSCSQTISIKEKEWNLINSIYPNPTRNTFRIDFVGQERIKIRILNLLGEEVLFEDSYTSNNDVDVSKLPKGMYLLEMFESESLNKLIMKKKIILN